MYSPLQVLHSLAPIRPHLHANFSPRTAPVLTVDSGDTVCFATPDVGWGLEPPNSPTASRRKVEPRDPIADNGPCLCGPIAVRGSRPGDTLEVAIEYLRPGPWGWTYAGRGTSTPALNAALGVADAPLTLLRWALDQDRAVAMCQTGRVVPVRPFLGIVGLASALTSNDVCGWTPRASGGNMDCRELVAGSTLFLPVMAEGALLSVGDGHAAQGDGELSGTAIECAMEEARLRLTIRRDLAVTSPRAKTPEGWVTMAFAHDLDTAAASAASSMLDLMVELLSVTRPEALALASSVVDLRITQMVNPLRGVHAVLSL